MQARIHPDAGLPAFAALERDPDADVQWVVRSNRGKARLARLLGSDESPGDGA